jgi:hypothetical protein
MLGCFLRLRRKDADAFYGSMNSKLLIILEYTNVQHQAAAGRISITASARRRRAQQHNLINVFIFTTSQQATL